MKKIFSTRSLLALFLIASMLLTLLCACNKEEEDDKSSDGGTQECTEHVDGNSDGKCDNCDEDMSPDTLDKAGDVLANAVIEQLSNAQSMKIEVTIDILNSGEYWDTWYDYETDEETLEKYSDYSEGIIKLSATVAKTENGANARLDVYTRGRGDADGEFETEEFTALYLVDGVVYSYDAELDAYLKTDLKNNAVIAEIEAMIAEVAGKIEITEDEKNAIIASLGELAITAFDIKDNKGSISIDAKPVFDGFKNYITSIDTSAYTVSYVIDDALELISEDLTTKVILDELERIAGLTVNQALAEIDAMLTEDYGTTLQGIYDTVVNNPDFVEALTEILKEQADTSLTEAEIAETIEDIQSIKIADLIAQYEIGDVVIYDLIVSFIPNEDGEAEIPTCAELFDSIEALLEMTIYDFEQATGIAIFSSIKSQLLTITVNELNARLDLNFKGVFNIDTIEGEINYDVYTKDVSYFHEDEMKYDTSDTDLKISFKLYDISGESVAISAPTDKDVYYDIADEEFTSTTSDYERLGIYTNYDGTLWITLDVDEELGFYADFLDADLLKSTTITIDSELLSLSDWYGEIEFDTAKDLVIEIDPANGTFTVIECPEYDYSK